MNQVKCVHCHSDNVKETIEKNGFSAKKAIVGGLLVGPVGLLAGVHKSKDLSVVFECHNCLKTFTNIQLAKFEKSLNPLSRFQFLVGTFVFCLLLFIPISWTSLTYLESLPFGLVLSFIMGKTVEKCKVDILKLRS